MSTLCPKVTVLMPVYNGERFLHDSIKSILQQTFEDFEFLIIDDGSSDASNEVVESFKDSRIRLRKNKNNSGLVNVLNDGLRFARGDYVARMDCDDISLPERLAAQVAFLEAHPRVGVCGTWYRSFGDGGGRVTRTPTEPEDIRAGMLFKSVIGHPTVMFNRELLQRHKLRYDSRFVHVEDYELWARALGCFDMANVGKVLLRYRVHGGQISARFCKEQQKRVEAVRMPMFEALGIVPSADELRLHRLLSRPLSEMGQALIEDPEGNAPERVLLWLGKLQGKNLELAVFPQKAFTEILLERWLGFWLSGMRRGKGLLRGAVFPEFLRLAGHGPGYLAGYLVRKGRLYARG
ncbi:glycosyltransferase [uncultured Desulfuromonas sp.]|uniref:glycosyltransferase family 2 protein n=1 Tax=uncultured Desulfuromonas sp. TaxID=181013 RepID=UPI00260D6A49|nr:glycosyltransferase [uncultured Desulfuromonas sp.]